MQVSICEIMRLRFRVIMASVGADVLGNTMNWRRGLIRLWLLSSFVWVLFVCIIERVDVTFGQMLNARDAADELTIPKTFNYDIVASALNEPQILEFGDYKIKVDESFFDLSSADQEKTVEEIADQLRTKIVSEPRRQLLSSIYFALFPIIIAFMAGVSFLWVALGFRKDHA